MSSQPQEKSAASPPPPPAYPEGYPPPGYPTQAPQPQYAEAPPVKNQSRKEKGFKERCLAVLCFCWLCEKRPG